MDILTQSKMNAFCTRNGFTGKESALFEYYIASVYGEKFIGGEIKMLDDIVVAGGTDGGVDIAVIAINGKVITDPDDIDDAIEDRDDNDIRAIFVQAKTSESFDTKLISKFLHGVELLTKVAANRSSSSLPAGLTTTASLLQSAISNIDRFRTTRIPAELYYVTTSKSPSSDALKEAQVTEAIQRIRDLDVYNDDISVKLHGRNEIASKVKERSGPQNIEFQFSRKQLIPEASGIEQAYIGVIQSSELIKLIFDGTDIRSGIFDDNVRLYQGDTNHVNSRIFSTLASTHSEMFPFLNNGVTVVARKLTNVADRFSISGYQIVNGGQTSHQIARWFQLLMDEEDSELAKKRMNEVWVPIKIIETSQPEVVSEITIATNLQTSIAATDIQGSTQDAKDVEQYFEQTGQEGLRYARQSGIATAYGAFPRLRVVTTPDLNRAVASCVFGESSRAIGSPNELTSENSFVWGGYPVALYYMAAWIVYRIESYFRRNRENYELQALKAAKYHIAMLIALKAFPGLSAVYTNNQDTRAMRLVAGSLSNDKWKTDIESNIPACVEIVADHFSDIVTKQSRSLRKDDVRARRVQTELRAMIPEP
ncbi:AIPR family protein [Gordonia polyisoprenivorans]|uniref:AIPR family protein n=1 Tax=Gordonia polyisoprenivorans TaxID=84595 RepID=UPI0009E2633E|nr:AIPR family protein [Gordonia polyisoprenivorans]